MTEKYPINNFLKGNIIRTVGSEGLTFEKNIMTVNWDEVSEKLHLKRILDYYNRKAI
jgi:hypothetical protein